MPSTSPKSRKPRTSFGTLGEKSGKFYPSYVGPDRTRYRAPSPFSNRSQARSWLNAQQAAIEAAEWTPDTARQLSGKFVPSRKRTVMFEHYAKQYVDTKLGPQGRPLAAKTVENYEWHLRDSYGLFNGRDLAYLSEDDILTWWRDRLDTGKLTAASQAYVLLGGIFEKAVKERIVGTSPVDIPGAASLRTGKEVRIPTDAEVADVLDALEEGFWGSLFLTEAWSQARFGELIGLRRQAVLIDYRDVSGELVPELTISIRVGVTRTRKDGIVIGTPKSSAGLREVMLPELASRELLAYMQKTETPETQPTDFIWPSRTDIERPLAYCMYWDEWAATIKRANVPYFNAHGLRHYGLTAYAQSGATLKEIQERGGHSSPSVSMRYQHAATSRRSELVNRAAAGAASAAERQREVRRKKAELAAQLAALDAEERELEGG